MKMHTKPYTLHLKEFRDVPLNAGRKMALFLLALLQVASQTLGDWVY